jgi:flagellar basal-body rod protein FlgG
MYSAAAGALVAQASLDVISNNLANTSTSGFKRALLQVESQPNLQIYRFQTDPGQVAENRLPGVPTQTPVGLMGTGSQIYGTPTNFEQGQIATNGETLSFALSGPGFFAVRNPQTNQTTYTRDGLFMRDADGNLSTTDGSVVLDPAGNTIAMPSLGKIEVDRQGNINVDGQVSGQIGVFDFNNRQALVPQGASQFLAPQNAGIQAATDTSVIQYASEKSNADVINSIVGLITNERWFDANEKSISTQDDATNQAIAIVGRSS